MKVAVCIKHVPEGQGHFDARSMHLDRTRDGTLNPVDANAVEEALRVKEASGAEVLVISMGPSQAVESLRKALALGADRAILVSDDAAAGSDSIATSKVLAKVLERESPDLVLFGQQAVDAGGGVLWAAIAELMHVPFVSQATALTVQETAVHVRRQTEFGYDVIDAPLPAFVAVSDAINDPRYASLKGMMGAKKKPCEVLSLADIGLAATDAGDAGSKTEVLSFAEPATRGGATRIEIEDDGETAQAIVDFLVEKGLL